MVMQSQINSSTSSSLRWFLLPMLKIEPETCADKHRIAAASSRLNPSKSAPWSGYFSQIWFVFLSKKISSIRAMPCHRIVEGNDTNFQALSMYAAGFRFCNRSNCFFTAISGITPPHLAIFQ